MNGPEMLELANEIMRDGEIQVDDCDLSDAERTRGVGVKVRRSAECPTYVKRVEGYATQGPACDPNPTTIDVYRGWLGVSKRKL